MRELKQLLASYDVEIVGLYEVRGASVPPERGHSAQENAFEKARAAYDLTGLNSIADDTALEVDTLGGKPGIYAARLAGPGATYTDNRNRLLEVLTGVAPEQRTARFRTACVACLTDGRECLGEGVLEGRIAEQPHGEGGFGYDPIFELLDGRSLAELSPEEKNRISHRAIAMQALVKQLNLH